MSVCDSVCLKDIRGARTYMSHLCVYICAWVCARKCAGVRASGRTEGQQRAMHACHVMSTLPQHQALKPCARENMKPSTLKPEASSLGANLNDRCTKPAR